MHKKNKHGTSQTCSGALQEEQTVPHHVQQETLHKHCVPIQNYNHAFRQWLGWSSSYKNIEARNKQLEAQKAHVNALRDKDANMLQQADQEVFVLKSELQGLSNEKDRLKEKYKQKFKSLKYEIHPCMRYLLFFIIS